MTESLAHRGPSDQGIELLSMGNHQQVALGHRRLIILDLTTRGHQPMKNEPDNTVMTYNGEVYNYLELKEELKFLGYTFHSTSDTEVILKAYQHWGTDCFKRFNGMWALAIYDQKTGKLILSRDRFGKKPLYYFKGEDCFVFGSEPKALFKHPSVVKKPNYDKIFRYLAYNYRYVDIDNDSYFEGVQHVPKSSFMVVDSDLSIDIQKYWQLDSHSINNDIADRKAIDEYRELFIDSVRLRLRSDVPVGCMLSGGLDSTAITSVAYKSLNCPITTFSGVTGEEKGVYDESDYIEAVIKETRADAHYLKTDPADIFETVEEMLSFHDEPISTVTWYSLYLIAKKVAKENIPVILNGHGGDELLAGYWDHYHYHFFDLEEDRFLKERDAEIQCWENNHQRNPQEIEKSRQLIKLYANSNEDGKSRFYDYSVCFNAEFAQRYRRNIRVIPVYRPLLQNRLESELLYETIPASLRPEDRNTMAHSLESRSPFLDYRLVEYCFTLPGRMKIRNGLGKWVHREAMKGILPEKVRTRKDKAGFIAPADEWFRTINKQQVEELINSESFKNRGIFDVGRINEIFVEHQRGEKNHQMFLWQLINLELWFRLAFEETKASEEAYETGHLENGRASIIVG